MVRSNARKVPRFLRFRKFHWYIVPIIALVVWWGMLIAMLSAWSLQGRPIYAFMGHVKQDPVYISDIGATNLQPLFISCAGFQAIFFVGTLLMEHILRTKHKLQPYISPKQPIFGITSVVCSAIGQLGILFVAIFNTKNFHHVHFSMVGIFIAFCFLACLFNFFNSFIFGNFPDRLHPNHERVIFGEHKWANLYMVSFALKCGWMICAIVFAICFGAYMHEGDNSMSAVFEWTISFWYGLLLVMWCVDLFPSAVKSYKLRHPELYDEYAFKDTHPGNNLDNDKFDQRSMSTDNGTYVNSTQPVENNNLIHTTLNNNSSYDSYNNDRIIGASAGAGAGVGISAAAFGKKKNYQSLANESSPISPIIPDDNSFDGYNNDKIIGAAAGAGAGQAVNDLHHTHNTTTNSNSNYGHGVESGYPGASGIIGSGGANSSGVDNIGPNNYETNDNHNYERNHNDEYPSPVFNRGSQVSDV